MLFFGFRVNYGLGGVGGAVVAPRLAGGDGHRALRRAGAVFRFGILRQTLGIGLPWLGRTGDRSNLRSAQHARRAGGDDGATLLVAHVGCRCGGRVLGNQHRLCPLRDGGQRRCHARQDDLCPPAPRAARRERPPER